MILDAHQQFVSPMDALAHHGVKGMHWGVRKEEESSGNQPSYTDAEKKAARRAMAKKAAIGAGVLTAAAGAAFVAYKLNQSGALPISSIRKANQANPKQVAQVKQIIHEQKDVIMLTRGKHTGQTFLKKGDTPNFFTHWEDAFAKEVGNADAGTAFVKLASGKIAAAFRDPAGRTDFAGRPISHQVIIPKSMSSGIDSLDDVQSKIWPTLKESYDSFYKTSLTPKHQRA